MPDSNHQYQLENLVVLQYAANNCSLQVRDFLKMSREDAHLGSVISVDVKNGTWSYGAWRDKKIGSARGCSRNDSGVIGVYDKTLTAHLDLIVNRAVEITRLGYSSPLAD